jgi:hypothetical protein
MSKITNMHVSVIAVCFLEFKGLVYFDNSFNSSLMLFLITG